MKENQSDQQVVNNQKDQKDQSTQSAPRKDGAELKDTTTMVEDAQSDTQKELQEDEHQHVTKTPIGEQNNKDESKSGQKGETETREENKNPNSNGKQSFNPANKGL